MGRGKREARLGGKSRVRGHTVEPLGFMGDVRHAEVSCEDDDCAWEEKPRCGRGVCQEDFEEGKGGIKRVSGDVRPCWWPLGTGENVRCSSMMLTRVGGAKCER